ncbi:two-component system response regulator YesN [Paenibacillus sp. V4I9]|nr:two-component system response regulator YesN [Paenibacillus sp. V4I9]
MHLRERWLLFMYKMLLVDDESRQLKALANIVRALRPEYKVYEALNGRLALDFIQDNPMDVIMTDIRMPEMDGLQLVEALYENKNRAKVILLTGYGEFEYAQKAIRFGIFDYIVKPFGKSGLEKLLLKIDQVLELEYSENKRREDMARKLDESLPVYQTHLLNKWIHGQLNEAESKELEKAVGTEGTGILLITELGTSNPIEASKERIMHQMNMELKSLLKSRGHVISFFLDGQESTVAFVVSSKEARLFRPKELLVILENWISNCKAEHGMKITVGVGAAWTEMMVSGKSCYEQALSALQRKFFLGSGQAIFFEEMTRETSKVNPLAGQEEELLAAIKKGDKDAMNNSINALFEPIPHLTHLNPAEIKEDVIRLIVFQLKAAKHFIGEEEYHMSLREIRIQLVSCEDYNELRYWTKKILLKMIDLYQTAGKDKNRIIVEKCMTYIQEHFAEELSLELIAQMYHFNTSYFSSLFKNHTGTSLSDYVIKVRMDNAKRLLTNSDHKISDIAVKIGYKDSAYFIRLFKRELGISPNKFRHLTGKES